MSTIFSISAQRYVPSFFARWLFFLFFFQIAQQVVTGAPKQKSPFRLWKTETGKEGYDKSKPS